MIRCPASDERPQNEGYRAKSFARPILRSRFLPAYREVLLLRFGLQSFSDRLNEIAPGAALLRVRCFFLLLRLTLRFLAIRGSRGCRHYTARRRVLRQVTACLSGLIRESIRRAIRRFYRHNRSRCDHRRHRLTLRPISIDGDLRLYFADGGRRL